MSAWAEYQKLAAQADRPASGAARWLLKRKMEALVAEMAREHQAEHQVGRTSGTKLVTFSRPHVPEHEDTPADEAEQARLLRMTPLGRSVLETRNPVRETEDEARSPTCGLTMAELHALTNAGEIGRAVLASKRAAFQGRK